MGRPTHLWGDDGHLWGTPHIYGSVPIYGAMAVYGAPHTSMGRPTYLRRAVPGADGGREADRQQSPQQPLPGLGGHTVTGGGHTVATTSNPPQILMLSPPPPQVTHTVHMSTLGPSNYHFNATFVGDRQLGPTEVRGV